MEIRASEVGKPNLWETWKNPFMFYHHKWYAGDEVRYNYWLVGPKCMVYGIGSTKEEALENAMTCSLFLEDCKKYGVSLNEEVSNSLTTRSEGGIIAGKPRIRRP